MLLFVIFALVAVATAQDVRVTTSRGAVIGFKVDYGSDTSQLYYGKADVFLGIPYVEPPVGNLRFAKPVPMKKFPNSPLVATKFQSICPQQNNPHFYSMSEDCLHLNIFSPNVSATEKYPVMVWIHGGSLQNGHAQNFGVKGAVRNLVSRGVVVVTFQYRIGLLGFFTTFTDDFPPNLGMLDQVEAIRWVNEEIANFGGDPKQITLFGQSAGAASVSAHTYSPLSQNLFQKAIMESGMVLTCFDGALGFDGNSEDRALKLCNYTLTENDRGDQSLKDCLMNMDYKTWMPLEAGTLLGWHMVQDDYFLPDVPRNLQKNRENIPILIGSNKDEWAYFELLMLKNGVKTLESYSRLAFEYQVISVAKFLGTHEAEVIKMVEAIYAPGASDNDHLKWLQITSDVFSGAGFTGFIVREVNWYLQNGNNNLYLYEFVHPSVVAQITKVDGWNPVPHEEEMHFVWMQEDDWNTAIASGNVTEYDYEIADFLGKVWTNFAKYGNPGLGDSVWPATSNDGSMNYLEIGTEKTMKKSYRSTDDMMWNKAIPSIVGVWPPERPVSNNKLSRKSG